MQLDIWSAIAFAVAGVLLLWLSNDFLVDLHTEYIDRDDTPSRFDRR